MANSKNTTTTETAPAVVNEKTVQQPISESQRPAPAATDENGMPKTEAKPAETASVAVAGSVIVQSATIPPPSDVSDPDEQAKGVFRPKITDADVADAKETVAAAGASPELIEHMRRQAELQAQSQAAIARDIADGMGQLRLAVKVVQPGAAVDLGQPATPDEINRMLRESVGFKPRDPAEAQQERQAAAQE